MRYYEDLTEGRVWEYDARYEVTEEEIMEVGRRWDPQPFHIDAEAAKAPVFKGLVASSVHLFAIATCLAVQVPEDLRSATVSGLGFGAIRLHAPARPGDVLRARSEVLEQRLSNSRP